MRSAIAALLILPVSARSRPGEKNGSPDPDTLFRHAATFTTFCDTGSVQGGDCWCKGGSATAAIGDGSWLWHKLVGQPCAAQPDDHCDCTSCGGLTEDCPHDGCWQCQGVNPPQCNPNDDMKRCEVTVHGTRGAEKYYITEVCPSAHPCNRCKDDTLQRCAAWSPLAIDVCGTTWSHVFETSRSEAVGYVTLSCHPNAYEGEQEYMSTATLTQATCYSKREGDASEEKCEDWCSPDSATDHCQWCKCRGCESMKEVSASFGSCQQDSAITDAMSPLGFNVPRRARLSWRRLTRRRGGMRPSSRAVAVLSIASRGAT